MINTVQARAAIANASGEDVVMSKAQYGEMLTELELGNQARMLLTNTRSMLNAGALRTGLPA